ncbi:MAG: peptidylprolyl isomerase [Bacteroidetes bacterium HGW-Bacteroidetes-16]|jgi:FKBP-type peptidyl-prolyl cis-trans isomerase|nr:MAG: peptidylprolyl isomerase [Bacteroidetes bacterium HGW-Bacteroidetes-16]
MKSILKPIITTCAIVLFLLATLACKKEDGSNQNEIDRELIETYVFDHQLTGTFTTTGLYYQIQLPGTEIHPSLSSTITVSYKGFTLSGSAVDDGSFVPFKLNQLITGWQEGLQLIGEGGKIKLIIPSAQAYGKEVLVFDITLHYFSK